MKRTVSILLTLLLVLAMLPMSAAAADTEVWVAGVQLTGGENYVNDGNGSVTESSDGSYNIKLNDDGTVLTLKDLDVKGAEIAGTGYETYGLYINGPVNIVLEGENKVSSDKIDGDDICAAVCLTSRGGYTFVISGSGSLEAEAGTTEESAGIYCPSDIIQMDGGTVAAKGGGAGIFAAGLIVNGGTVNAAGGDTDSGESTGILAGELLINNGTVTAKGGDTVDNPSFGIYAYGAAINGGTVTAKGGNTVGEASCGIFSFDAAINGGTVTANGGNTSNSTSCGIYADVLTISDGIVNAVGDNADGDGESDGIYADSVLNINGGTVNAAGGAAGLSSGISAFEFNMTDDKEFSTVAATGGLSENGGNSYGVYAGDGALSGGLLIATGGTAVNSDPEAEFGTVGFYSDSMFDVGGGMLVARAGAVNGAFSGDNRLAAYSAGIAATAKIIGAVKNGRDIPLSMESLSEGPTSLAIAGSDFQDISGSGEYSALTDPDSTGTVTLPDPSYIVSSSPTALALPKRTDGSETSLTVSGNLFAISLYEGSEPSAGISSEGSLSLSGDAVAAVGGMSTGMSSGFYAGNGYAEESININAGLIAVGGGMPGGDSYGYNSSADTFVNGILTAVGIPGASSRGVSVAGLLSTEDTGSILGIASPALRDGNAADGISVAGDFNAAEDVIGIGAAYGLSGAESVNGGTYMGGTAAVSKASLASGHGFFAGDTRLETAETVGAPWQPVTVKELPGALFITFDPNGGSGYMPGQAFFIGNSEIALSKNKFKNEGYDFARWNTASDGSGDYYSDGETVDFRISLTLYARWKPAGLKGQAPTGPDSADGRITGISVPSSHIQYREKGTDTWTTVTNTSVIENLAPGTYEVRSAEDDEGADPSEPADVTVPPYVPYTPPSDSGECPRDETCPIDPYTDTDNNGWYHDGVHYVLEKGYMNGTGNNIFDPEGNMSRAMMVTVLYRVEGEPEVDSAERPFTDMETDEWYTDALIWAAQAGVVNGYGNTKFGPYDPVTREQVAVMLRRYADYKGIDVSASSELGSFKDGDQVRNYALTSVKWAFAVGLLEGKENNILDPRGFIRRCETATMVMRFCENILN